MPYRLLTEFQHLFDGKSYFHRDSSRGDFVAMHLYEDLLQLNRSEKLRARVYQQQWVLNAQNRVQGRHARRGDGTFGEIIPGTTALSDPGFLVSRAKIATIEIGTEVKILSKAMIKQIDRVATDLQNQAHQFRRGGGTPICVAIVGINHAAYTTSYEGDRAFKTDGTRYKHPVQEAAEAERRLLTHAVPAFDEFIVLRYRATNESPFPFEWLRLSDTEADYGAALIRISREYDRRF